MKKHYRGIDVLRGLGIFSVLSLHTAFYYYDGIYDLDLSNPPLIITLIGAVLGTVIAFPLSNAMETAMGLDQGTWFFIMAGVVLSSLITFAFSIIPSFQNSGFEAAGAMRTAG